MDFEEYLNLHSQPGTFVQYYRCLPISVLKKENVDEDGNRVFLPPSALDRLAGVEVQFPMLFQIQNPSTARVTHCGVLEFVAEEGFVHMPTWLMAHLSLADNDLVLVRNVSLPQGTFVKLQPHSSDFARVSYPRELLEYNFRKYSCLTVGETITVTEGERRYYLDVVEARPADAVCSIDTDCSVDFATALDYVEPQSAPAPAVANDAPPAQPQPQFTGVAMRMDGKPVEQPPPAPAPVAGQGARAPRPFQFTGVAMRMDGKPVKPPAPAPSPAAASAGASGALKRKIRFGSPSAAAAGAGGGVRKSKEDGGSKDQKGFTGTRYSLQD